MNPGTGTWTPRPERESRGAAACGPAGGRAGGQDGCLLGPELTRLPLGPGGRPVPTSLLWAQALPQRAPLSWETRGPVENGAVLHVPRGACARRPVWPAGSPRPAAPSEAEAVPGPGEGGRGERRELSARPPRPQALQGSHSPAGGADPAAQGVGLTERPAFSQEAERGVRPCTNQRTALSDHCPLPLLTCPRAEGPGLTGAQGSGRGESPACSLKTRALQTTVLRENTPSARPTETAL